MLVRLQSTLGCSDLVNQMVLVPQMRALGPTSVSEINLVVGFSSSAHSLTALDLTLWIAHQTRLATGKPVTVQVVYVVERPIIPQIPVFAEVSNSTSAWVRPRSHQTLATLGDDRGAGACATIVALPEATQSWRSEYQFEQVDQFEQADRILWQARCLADEWRGSLKTHLRFGALATELRSVVKTETASLLIVGCESADHPLVQELGQSFPCPVLGIPTALLE
jgi:hypothetical protein